MPGSLKGKRILVVEDEYFIAADLKRALAREGAVVVGPVARLDRGMTLADGDPVDAAVLDINLEGGMSFPLADRLGEQRVPYVFLTGYDDWAVPEPYRDVPRVTKPFSTDDVLARVGRLVERHPCP